MNRVTSWLIAAVTLAGLFFSSRYNYLLFHTLAELFSIVIGCGIFLIAWNCRRFLESGCLRLFGVAFLFVSILDLTHALAYSGMPIFPGGGTNLPTQLWIAARLLESLSLLAAPLVLHRRLRNEVLLLIYSLLTLLLLLAILVWKVFPDCYVEGQGLTPFKRITEYVIIAMLLGAAALLLQQRQAFDPKVLRYLVGSILLTIGSELAFTFYISVYGTSNLVGHYLKIVAFYLVYKAIIETGLTQPYALLLRESKQQQEEWEHTFESVPDLIAILDQDHRIVRVNRAMAQRLGRPPGDCIGQRCFGCVHGASAPPGFCPLRLTLQDGQPHTVEVHEPRLGGYFLVSTTRMRDGEGQPPRIVHVARDITARKQAEEALQQTAKELERSNQDLEQFAYVASHDLQEPLRAVGGFVKLLQRRCQNQLDAKATEYIAGAVEGATRMERLISDLLAFSRIESRGTPFVPANLNDLLQDALYNLQTSIRTAGAMVTNDPLPTLPVDPTQVTQLLQNLIGNAIKFRKEDAAPQVHLSATPAEGQWVFAVRDNGIGIEPQYYERIFQLFQRLHTRKHYPGTGIGLALCKKIVERHGGKIWLESQPGQGTTFYFSLKQH